MKKKSVVLVLVATMVVGSLTGCGNKDALNKNSKKEIIQMYRDLEYERDELQLALEEQENVLNSLQVGDAPTAAVSSVGDGTDLLTFNSYDSKIIFPSSFQYPGSSQISANGKINIVDNVSVNPGSNWICKLTGPSLELEHTSKISGVIKIGHIDDLYDRSLLQSDVLSPWLASIPQENIVYNNIFLADDMWGVQATTPTVIDSEDAFLRCGMFAYGEYSCVYVFVYRGAQDINKDESITSLLNSIEVLGKNLTVEG